MTDTRLLLGGIFHETNSFAAGQTGRAEFESRCVAAGSAVRAELGGTDTAVAGVLAVADETDGLSVVPSLVAAAVPGPIVEQDVYESYCDRILADIAEATDNLDGVLLRLHGSMVTGACRDADGDLLAVVRERVGPETPVVATLDLHANVSARMVSAADALVSYRTYPHVDRSETGTRATRLLCDLVERSVDTELHVERPPMITYPPRQDTDSEPMASVMARARELETREGILAVNVNPGFMQSDVSHMGLSVVTVAESGTTTGEVAEELARDLWERRESFVADYPTAAAGVEQAREVLTDGRGPVVLADTGDNPGSGGATDGTVVLRELLATFGNDEYDVGLALIRDPEVVAAAIDAGVGTTITVDLGGKTDDLHGEPITDLTASVTAITDGVYTNRGPVATGQTKRLGRTVLLRCGADRRVRVVVTENRVQPYDRAVWHHVGVRPANLDVIALKSKNHFRADYEERAGEILVLDTPGAGAISPHRFEFQHIDRPKFPLDEMTDDDY